MKKKLFSKKPFSIDFSLLVLRLVFGIAMITHGWPKFQKALTGNFKFGDPIGLGPEASLILAAFAEFICSILIILGLGTRLATIPLMFTMGVAMFIVHASDGFGAQEKAFLFLGAFFTIFLTGPGKYSIDNKI